MSQSPANAELHDLRGNWGWFVALGILLSLLGFGALSYPLASTLYVVMVLGILLLISGAGQLIGAFSARRWSGFFLLILSGVLSLVVGIFLVEHPGRGAEQLTLFIGALLMVSGLFRIASAVGRRYPHWGLEVLGGFISLVLGIMLWRQWPESSFWFIGMCVGIDLMFQGFSWLFFGFALKGLPKSMVS